MTDSFTLITPHTRITTVSEDLDDKFTQADLEATRPLLEKLEVRWWLAAETHKALAEAYAMGRKNNT